MVDEWKLGRLKDTERRKGGMHAQAGEVERN